MDKEEKIRLTLKQDKIFIVTETEKYKYFLCKGVNDRVYDIILFKESGRWKCNCGNVRKSNCYHIETAMRLED